VGTQNVWMANMNLKACTWHLPITAIISMGCFWTAEYEELHTPPLTQVLIQFTHTDFVLPSTIQWQNVTLRYYRNLQFTWWYHFK